MTFEDLDAEDFNENNESFFDYLCVCIERPKPNFVIFSIYVSIVPCMEMILKLRRKKTRVSSCRRTVLTLDDDKLLGEETLRMCEVSSRLATAIEQHG